MRARHLLLFAAISVGLSSSSLQAQEQQIPKELALALISYSAEGGEIIVGQMPPDLAATFTLPPGGRVLGSFVGVAFANIVMTYPGSTDSASAFARRSLVDHGWIARQPPGMRMGGLQYGPRATIPTLYCKSGLPEVIAVSAYFHGPATTLLRITRNTGPTVCDEERQTASASIRTSSGALVASSQAGFDSRFPDMPLNSLPPLWPPGNDYRASQVCRTPTGMNSQSQEQPLRTELSPAEVLAHYGRQLDSAGWKQVTGGATSVAGSWTNPGNGQEVTIAVTKMANQTGCYEVSLRATARRINK